MFQNAFHITLENKCEKNIKVVIAFEEGIVQKIVRHVIHSCK